MDPSPLFWKDLSCSCTHRTQVSGLGLAWAAEWGCTLRTEVASPPPPPHPPAPGELPRKTQLLVKGAHLGLMPTPLAARASGKADLSGTRPSQGPGPPSSWGQGAPAYLAPPDFWGPRHLMEAWTWSMAETCRWPEGAV